PQIGHVRISPKEGVIREERRNQTKLCIGVQLIRSYELGMHDDSSPVLTTLSDLLICLSYSLYIHIDRSISIAMRVHLYVMLKSLQNRCVEYFLCNGGNTGTTGIASRYFGQVGLRKESGFPLWRPITEY